jgi:general L-amino acid transport system substrate-binding protein
MRINRIVLVIALLVVTAFGSALFMSPDSAPVFAQESGSLLDTIRDRGVLNCGVSGELPGFSNPNADTGVMEGLDADFCRVLAAAIWGSAVSDENINFVSLTANERFTALQAGEVDVLHRNTTWTLTRDADLGSDFGPSTFYDGQGLLVKVDLGVTSLEELDGATFCSTTGTTTEKNLADAMANLGYEFTLVGVVDAPAGITAFEEGACDVLTSDKSQLASLRSASSDPSSMEILGDTLSKEPLGPMYLGDDSAFGDVVNWSVYATFQAEEFGINSTNIDEFAGNEDVNIRRFLGEEETLGTLLGVPDTFAADIVRFVGNYAEIYDRNVVPIGVPREGSLNAMWTQGGLLYAPAWR